MKNITCCTYNDEIERVFAKLSWLGYKWVTYAKLTEASASDIRESAFTDAITILPNNEDMTIQWTDGQHEDSISAEEFLDQPDEVCRTRYILMRDGDIYCFQGADISCCADCGTWAFTSRDKVGGNVIYTAKSKETAQAVANWKKKCGCGDVRVVAVEETVRILE